jgi:putative thioredoxin
MPEPIIDVGQEDFQAQVLDASFDLPVVVDFWAPWCGPCRVLGPILEKLAGEFAGRVRVVKVNTDQNPDVATAFGVRGIPNVKAFLHGRLVDEFSGALPEGHVRRFLEGLIPSPAEALCGQAQAAREAGEDELARVLLEKAIEADPSYTPARLDLAEWHIDMGNPETAGKLLEDLTPEFPADQDKLQALRARLNLANAAGGADLAALGARVAADPADLAARLALAQALALREDYRPAFEQLLEIVRRDRSFQEDAGRKTMVSLFQMLAGRPDAQEIVREYRAALARTLH